MIREIVDAAEVLRQEQLVEIGPGRGALTQEFIRRGNTHFTVIEIDPAMGQFLEKNIFPGTQIKLVQCDFLSFDLHQLPASSTQFVSNLPYDDAAAILGKVLAYPHFKTAVFMFQKEQAQKITARPGADGYGALSILTQLRARVSLICNVGRGCFHPPPKVESRVLAFEHVTPPADFDRVRRVVERAFLHRRKTLLNALMLAGYDKEKITAALAQVNVPLTARPEELTPAQFVTLTDFL